MPATAEPKAGGGLQGIPVLGQVPYPEGFASPLKWPEFIHGGIEKGIEGSQGLIEKVRDLELLKKAKQLLSGSGPTQIPPDLMAPPLTQAPTSEEKRLFGGW